MIVSQGVRCAVMTCTWHARSKRFMVSCKKALCRCCDRLAGCTLKLAAELDFAMASGSDEERWARLGGGAGGADGQAELPEKGALQHEHPEGAGSRRLPNGDGRAGHLLGHGDSQHSEEWWDSWSSGGSSSWGANHQDGWWRRGGGQSDPGPRGLAGRGGDRRWHGSGHFKGGELARDLRPCVAQADKAEPEPHAPRGSDPGQRGGAEGFEGLDPWARAWRRTSGQIGSDFAAGDKPTEDIPVPSFNGQAGEEGEVGSSAISYLRKVEVWERVTRLLVAQWGLGAEGPGVGGGRGAGPGPAQRRGRVPVGQGAFHGCEVIQVGRIMSQFFRVLKRGRDQSVRSFSGEFDHMISRLAEVQVSLPETVLAWMYIDKLKLGEAGEISLLVRNEYNLKRYLQEAALIHDRSSRKPWEESRLGRSHGKGGARGVHVTELDSDDEAERARQKRTTAPAS